MSVKILKNKRGAALMNVLVIMLVLTAFGALFLSLSFYFLQHSRDKAISLSSEYEVKTVSERIATSIMNRERVEVYAGGGLMTLMDALNKVKNDIAASVPDYDPAQPDVSKEERVAAALEDNIKLTGNVDGDSRKQYTVTMATDGLSVKINVTIVSRGVKTQLNSRIKILPDGWSNEQFQENMENIFKTAASTYVYSEGNLCDGLIDADNDGVEDDECGFCYSYRRYNGAHLDVSQIPKHLHIQATREGGTFAEPQDPICVSLAPIDGVTNADTGRIIADPDDIKFFRPADSTGRFLKPVEQSDGSTVYYYENDNSPYQGSIADVQYIVDGRVFGKNLATNETGVYFNEGAYIALDYPATRDGQPAGDGVFADIIINGSCQIYQGNIKGKDYANTYYGYGAYNDPSKDGPTAGAADRNLYVNGDCVIFGANVGNYAYINGNYAAIDSYMNGDHTDPHNMNSDLTRINGSAYLGSFSDYADYRNDPGNKCGIVHGNIFVRDQLFVEGVQIVDERINTFNRYVGGSAKFLGTYVDFLKADGGKLVDNKVPGAGPANTDGDAYKPNGIVMHGGWNVQGDFYSDNVRWYTQWDGQPDYSTWTGWDSLKIQKNYTVNIGGSAEMYDSHVMAKKFIVGGDFYAENTGFEMIMWQNAYHWVAGVVKGGEYYCRVETCLHAGGDVTIIDPATVRMNHIFSGGNVVFDFTGSPKVNIGFGKDWEELRRAMIRPYPNTDDTTPGIQANGNIFVLGQIDDRLHTFYVEMGMVATDDIVVSGDVSIVNKTFTDGKYVYTTRNSSDFSYKSYIENKLANDSTNPVKLQNAAIGSDWGSSAASPAVGGVSVSMGKNVGLKAGGSIVMYQYASNDVGTLSAAGGDVIFAATLTPGLPISASQWNISSATDIKSVDAQGAASNFWSSYSRLNISGNVTAHNIYLKEYQLGNRERDWEGGMTGNINCDTFVMINGRNSLMIFNAAQLYPRIGNMTVNKGLVTVENTFFQAQNDDKTMNVAPKTASGDDAKVTFKNANFNFNTHNITAEGDVDFERCENTRMKKLNANGDLSIQYQNFTYRNEIIVGGDLEFDGAPEDYSGRVNWDDHTPTCFAGYNGSSVVKAGGDITIEDADNYTANWTMDIMDTLSSNGNVRLVNCDDIRIRKIYVKGNLDFINFRTAGSQKNQRTDVLRVGGNFTFDNRGFGTNVPASSTGDRGSLWAIENAVIGGNLNLYSVVIDSNIDGGNNGMRVAVGGSWIYDNSSSGKHLKMWKYGMFYAAGNMSFTNVDMDNETNMSHGSQQNTGFLDRGAVFLMLSKGRFYLNNCSLGGWWERNGGGWNTTAYPTLTNGTSTPDGDVIVNGNYNKIVWGDGRWKYLRMYSDSASMDSGEREDWNIHYCYWNDGYSVAKNISDAKNARYQIYRPASVSGYTYATQARPSVIVSAPSDIAFEFKNGFTWGDLGDKESPYLDADDNIIRDPALLEAAYPDVTEFDDNYTRDASGNIQGGDAYNMATNLYTNATLNYFRDYTEYLVRSKLSVALEWLMPNEATVAGINENVDASVLQNKMTAGTDGSWMQATATKNITIDRSGTFPWFDPANTSIPWTFDTTNGYSVRFDTTAGDLHIIIPYDAQNRRGMQWVVGTGCHFDVVGPNRVFIYMQTGFTLTVRKVGGNETVFGARVAALSPNSYDTVYSCFNNKTYGRFTKVLPNSVFNQLKSVQIFLIGVKGANNINISVTDSMLDAFIYMPYAKNSSVTVNGTSTDERYNIFGGVVASNIIYKGRAKGVKSDVPIDLSGLDFSVITGLPTGVGNNDNSFNGISINWEFEGYID